MEIPEGKSCKDCAHWQRCKALIQSLSGDEVMCDFAPAMFTAKEQHEEADV